MARNIKAVTPPSPWSPAEYSLVNVAAVQAVALGTATAEQQQRALKWIIHSAAQTYDLDYRTDPRDHAFVSGRRFVGSQIVTACNLDLQALRERTAADK